MIGNIIEFYSKHKDFDIIFNSNVIRTLGLKADQITFKCGNLNIPCILYSSSLNKARIIAKIDDTIKMALEDNDFNINLRFTFYISKLKQTMSFYVGSTILDYDRYDSDNTDLYFVYITFDKMPPREFIEILGEHITKQVNQHKRAVERVIVESNKNLESFIFKDGNGKKCVLTEISLFSAKILVSATPNEFKEKSSTLLIMKSSQIKGLGEMLGYIERVEEINSKEGIISIIITFDQESIPPGYKMWVAECMEMVRKN